MGMGACCRTLMGVGGQDISSRSGPTRTGIHVAVFEDVVVAADSVQSLGSSTSSGHQVQTRNWGCLIVPKVVIMGAMIMVTVGGGRNCGEDSACCTSTLTVCASLDIVGHERRCLPVKRTLTGDDLPVTLHLVGFASSVPHDNGSKNVPYCFSLEVLHHLHKE